MQIIAKVGSVVDVTYQATKEETGLTDVTLKINDETRSPDTVNYPDVILTEIGTTGRYYGSFIPDAVGAWTYTVDSVAKKGPLTRTVIVTNHDIDSLGILIANLNNLSSTEVQSIVNASETSILAAIANLESPAMLG